MGAFDFGQPGIFIDTPEKRNAQRGIMETIQMHEALKEGYIDIDDVIRRAKQLEKDYEFDDWVHVAVLIYEDKMKWVPFLEYDIRISEMKHNGKVWSIKGSISDDHRLVTWIKENIQCKTQFPKEEARKFWDVLVGEWEWDATEIDMSALDD